MRTETPKKVKKFRNGLKLEKFDTPPHTETPCIYNIEKIWGLCKMGVGVGVPSFHLYSFTFSLLWNYSYGIWIGFWIIISSWIGFWIGFWISSWIGIWIGIWIILAGLDSGLAAGLAAGLFFL